MIKLFGIKNCDNVRKAIKFLKHTGLEYTFVDMRESPVQESDIRQWVDAGANIQKLFNTRGTTYRTLNLKAENLDDNGKLAWMGKENMLIKRPVLIISDHVLVGFDTALYQHYLHPSSSQSKE